MTRKRTSVKKRKRHPQAKGNDVFVSLSDRDSADLDAAVEIEAEARGERVYRAGLLRELAMPHVREIVARRVQPAEAVA
jgi:hypothetical protein